MWVDTFFGKPVPTTINPWDARAGHTSHPNNFPIFIGKTFESSQPTPGPVFCELDGRNGITIAWNKTVKSDENICYKVISINKFNSVNSFLKGLYLFSAITIFQSLDDPESSGLDKVFLHDSRWCPYYLHDIEAM